VCNQPDILKPDFPPSNTIENKSWKKLKTVNCQDNNQSEPIEYTYFNGEKEVISWIEDCCEFKEWWILSCDKNETDFPNFNQSIQKIAFTWKRPEDRTEECEVELNGTVQEQVIDCNSTFRCIVNLDCNESNTEFPAIPNDKEEAFSWLEPQDRSTECSALDGIVQHKRVDCKNSYRCLVPICNEDDTEYPTIPEGKEEVFSWVEPENRDVECLALKGGIVQDKKVSCKSYYRCLKDSCTQENTEYPVIPTDKIEKFSWIEPIDRSEECINGYGTVQEKIEDCTHNYCCIILKDTEFPPLPENTEVDFGWTQPTDRSTECSNLGGITQERIRDGKREYRCVVPICTIPNTEFPANIDGFKYDTPSPWKESDADADTKFQTCTQLKGIREERSQDCVKEYRCKVAICTQPDKNFPPKAQNENIILAWDESEDKTTECTQAGGEVQESLKSCKKYYRCVKETDSCPVEGNEDINSYVSPSDRVFHEDIAIDGVSVGLHYSSADINETNNSTPIATKWTIGVHHRYRDGRLYLGSGTIINISGVLKEGNNIIIARGGEEFIFDSNLTHIATRDAYTKKIRYSFEYEDGKLITITDIFNQTTTLNRDSNGTVSSITAPHGESTYLNIDSNGDLTEVQYEDGSSYTFEYENHLMTKEIEPKGNEFLHLFDEHGKIIKVIDAEDGEWLFGSNTLSTLINRQVTRASGDIVKYNNYFLENGQLKIEKITPTGDIVLYERAIDDTTSSVTSCGMRQTTIYKQENGSLYLDPITKKRVIQSTTITTPSGLSKTVEYDKEYRFKNSGKLKRIIATQSENGKTYTNDKQFIQHKETSTTPEGKKDRIKYDNKMLLPKEINPHGFIKTKYTYNSEGQLIKSKQGDRVTHYSYNSRGELSSITDPKGRTTTYSYDSRDRLKTITYPDGNTLHYSYDANGNMQLLITPTMAEHSFGYNGVNKRVNYTSPLGKATTYSYDKQRRVTKITKPSGAEISTTYTNGRVTSIQTPEGTTNYTYSCQSNLASTTKGSESLNYSYDGTLLTQITQQGLLNQTLNYSYNNDFLISSFSYAGATQNYSYNQDNEPIQIGDYNISKSANGRIKTVTNGTYTQTTKLNQYAELKKQEDNLFKVILTRNKNGQIKKKVEKLQGSPRVVYRYTYDNRGRLIKVKKGNQVVEKYIYDSNGNRVKTTSKLRGVINEVQTYNSDDQIRLIGAVEQSYNDDGYLVEKKLPNGDIYSFEYGTLGELKKVITPTKTIEYLHNANNQRVAKKVDGVIVEKYLWANLTTLLAVYDANDTLVQRFEYADGRMPISMTQNGEKYYLHYDQVESLRAVSDSSHNIIKEVVYDSYGNILSDSNSSFKVPFGFAGGLYDSDTKLTRFGYRDYDAYTGKWTAKDPILFNGGDSNLYGYVLGDPVDFVDLNGLVSASIIWQNRPFIFHYFFGGGRTMNISPNSHLGQLIIKHLNQLMKENYQKIIKEASQTCGNYNTTIRDRVNFTGNEELFSIGDSSLVTKAYCTNGRCLISYNINDAFIDALDIHDSWSGNQDIPLARPYDIRFRYNILVGF